MSEAGCYLIYRVRDPFTASVEDIVVVIYIKPIWSMVAGTSGSSANRNLC